MDGLRARGARDARSLGRLRGADRRGGLLTARELLAAADVAAEAGRDAEARGLVRRARFLCQREGDLSCFAAVLRREARVLEGDARDLALSEAVRIARRAGDEDGEVEGLEELSRVHAEADRVGPALALLAEIARLQADRGDRGGEIRAALLAGRLLCEAWGPARDAGTGLVLLLWAEEAARVAEPDLARMTRDYVTGYQYTLSNEEFSAIEHLFELERGGAAAAAWTRLRAAGVAAIP